MSISMGKNLPILRASIAGQNAKWKVQKVGSRSGGLAVLGRPQGSPLRIGFVFCDLGRMDKVTGRRFGEMVGRT